MLFLVGTVVTAIRAAAIDTVGLTAVQPEITVVISVDAGKRGIAMGAVIYTWAAVVVVCGAIRPVVGSSISGARSVRVPACGQASRLSGRHDGCGLAILMMS
jgi:hypothetical protein